MDVGDVYLTKNYGSLSVVSYIDCYNVLVEFLATGYRVKTNTSNIKKGLVKDRLSPSVLGIGFIGAGVFKSKGSSAIEKRYAAWTGMFTRCYSKFSLEKSPSYKGCTVCVEWHDYQVFSEWYDDNFNEGMQLDKDILIHGNKVYSPSTCIFTTQKENIVKASAKKYKFISPSGEVVNIYNLSLFCANNALDPSAMVKVNKGKFKQHKGWVALVIRPLSNTPTQK